MKRNICKFPAPRFSEELSAHAFVLETDRTVMEQAVTLPVHRCILFVSGSACATLDTVSYSLEAGSLLFCFREERVTLSKIAEDTVYLYIDFSGGRAEELFRRFGLHKGNRVFAGFEGLIPLWRESLTRAGDMTVDLAAESMLLYTLSRFCGEREAESDLVGRVIDIIEKNFTDPTLSLGSLAEVLHYNEKYLSHAFKSRVGVGFSAYLRALRVKYAVSLFDRGLDSVKNVAFLSGFTDPLYFSGVFKQIVGLSPKDYLSSLRKKCEITE